MAIYLLNFAFVVQMDYLATLIMNIVNITA